MAAFQPASAALHPASGYRLTSVASHFETEWGLPDGAVESTLERTSNNRSIQDDSRLQRPVSSPVDARGNGLRFVECS